MAMPGFIEGHGHFTGLGQSMMNLDLMDTTSWDEIVRWSARGAKTAKPGDGSPAAAGTRRSGRRARAERRGLSRSTRVERAPRRQSRAARARQRPRRSSMRRRWSCRASRRRRRTRRRRILKDAAGNPTGVLLETASGLVRALGAWRAQKPDGAQGGRATRDRPCGGGLAAKGVTSFQDAGSSFDNRRRVQRGGGRRQLGIRLWVMVRDGNENIPRRCRAAVRRHGQQQPHRRGHQEDRSTARSGRTAHGCRAVLGPARSRRPQHAPLSEVEEARNWRSSTT